MANQLIDSKFFNTCQKDLSGCIKAETVISRNDFIYEAGRFLVANKSEIENFGELLHDYSRTLCAIVKYEMLEEMKKRIDNIDTFYHI